MAAMSVGLPASPSRSRTSKNILNRPLYEALKIGVHGDQPVGREDRVDRRLQSRARKARQQVVRQVVGVLAELDHLDTRVDVGVAEVPLDGRRQAIRQQPAR